MVRTVLGDVAGAALGHTQCHEHLFIEKGPSWALDPALCMEDVAKGAQELIAYAKAGGGCVLDAQPPFCGRMAQCLVAVSQQTGVHVVAVTGFHKSVFYPANAPIQTMTEDQLTRFFVSEVRQGMLSSLGERLMARAGAVKIAFGSDGAKGLDWRLTNSAIAAAKETGVPLLVHTEKDCDVMLLMTSILQAGVDGNHVIVCHMDRMLRDIGLQKAVLETGAYLNFDSVNRLKYLSHEEELNQLTSLLEIGYNEQLLLSLDTTNRRLFSYGADMGLPYILTDFIPMLRERGITNADIQRITVENPAAALAFH